MSAGPGQLVITNRLGRPVQRNSLGRCWREAVAAAGLPEGTRFHDLRHFYVSALIGSGLNVKVVQSRLGHATTRETFETYAHLWPDDDDAGGGMIESMFAAGGSSKLQTIMQDDHEHIWRMRSELRKRVSDGRVSL